MQGEEHTGKGHYHVQQPWGSNRERSFEGQKVNSEIRIQSAEIKVEIWVLSMSGTRWPCQGFWTFFKNDGKTLNGFMQKHATIR